MDLYTPLFRHVIMPIYDRIKGKNLIPYVNEYQQHLSWSPEQLKDKQWQELQKLIKHAFEHTLFYPKYWKTHGIDSYLDIQSMNEFEKLPVVTKSLIREHYREFVSDLHPNNIKKSTGGSTGQPFTFELDIESNTRREAVMWRGYGWLGAGLGIKTLYLWGADLGNPNQAKSLKNALYHGFYHRKMLNSFAMNKDNMINYIRDINLYKADAIVSYVNPLYELSRYIIANNLKVTSPKRILTGAEQLHDFQRDTIEKAFKAPVYNTFGCREFMLIAAECQQEKQLHMNVDHLVIEVIDEHGQTLIGSSGDLVITDLYNYGMPLIRYVNGDKATIENAKCNCGNPLPIISSIDGRKLDIIKTTTGATIPGELFPHMFKEFSGIERFQVIQKELASITVKLVCNQTFSTIDEQSIRDEINKYSKGSLNIYIERVDHIPLTKTGKHKVTICEV
ncbi:phenylacetate--CoA ligase family protein [Thalassotalea sp. G2M2-11]|uniref:phenylacetate--CoA ligase family protein n=1 Tax=Thalassotalea sp. G2M2-11 TaxID=2787627 RepID=UPI0019D18F4E|nr:phenylacetate--CoA ligase family protein [Thalassotalea sp. G2M2-11]